MYKKLLVLIFMVASFQLGGCASNASFEKMIATQPAAQTPTNKSLLNNIVVTTVAGGRETNPLLASQVNNESFRQALESSLKRADLYSNEAKYKLAVNLIELKQPLLGFDLTVTCNTHYRLENPSSDKPLFDKNIITSYTATVSDAFIAIERLKIANEGAVKANITEFIKELYLLPVTVTPKIAKK